VKTPAHTSTRRPRDRSAQATATFELDGEDIPFDEGQSILAAASASKKYIPHLCYHPEFEAHGSCRVCTVEINGRTHASCTTPARAGDVVASETAELRELRLGLVQLLFSEGNHFCPSCEASGSCTLQAWPTTSA
jgi:[NiFe] hydrogenase diaphorase moiety small subunit